MALVALALVVAGCGDGGGVDTTGSDTTGVETTGVGSDPGGTAQPAPGAEPSPEASLPGERVEIFPYRGARLAVVGVAADDRLNVRSGPGPGFDVVFELPPLAMEATATGHNRSLGGGAFWSEITAGSRRGWANGAYLLQPGQVSDITAALFPTPADRPSATTMPALAKSVAGMRASEEPPSRIVVVDGPRIGDLGEITVDVVGLGDDAQGGERLKIFAERSRDGRRFTVRTVEATALCTRGVTDQGLCV